MGLMAVALSGIAFLDRADLRQLIRSGDRSNLASIALIFVVSANLFALGLVLLLAGLRQLSLLTSVHARRGALARMGGVNLMLLCFAFVAVQDSGALEDALLHGTHAQGFLVSRVLLAGNSPRLDRRRTSRVAG